MMQNYSLKSKITFFNVSTRVITYAMTLVGCFLFFVLPVLAQLPSPLQPDLVQEIQGQGAAAAAIPLHLDADLLKNSDARIYIANLVKTALTAVGIIFIGLMVFGGALWFFSKGEEEKVTKARRVLTQAGVGLIVILASYSLALGVQWALVRATTEEVFWQAQDPRALQECGTEWNDFQKCQTGLRAKDMNCDNEYKDWGDCRDELKASGWRPQ
ncbi:MAG: pilin [bacterium]|nr:pilin [bacterium]